MPLRSERMEALEGEGQTRFPAGGVGGARDALAPCERIVTEHTRSNTFAYVPIHIRSMSTHVMMPMDANRQTLRQSPSSDVTAREGRGWQAEAGKRSSLPSVCLTVMTA